MLKTGPFCWQKSVHDYFKNIFDKAKKQSEGKRPKNERKSASQSACH